MKISWVLLTALVAVASAAVPAERNAITPDWIIEHNLEKLRKILQNGWEEKGIPVMAPWEVEKYELDIAFGNFVDFKGILSNNTLDGLDRFEAKVKLDILHLRYNYVIKFPDLWVKGYYDTLGHLFRLLPLFGIGNYKLAPNNLVLEGWFKIKAMKDGTYKLHPDFYTEISMESLDTDIEGMLLGDELNDLLNMVLQDMVPSALTNFQPQVSRIVHDIIFAIAGSVLGYGEPLEV